MWPFRHLKKAKQSNLGKLISLLDHHQIDSIFDVGANIGQYASELRQGGYAKKIISFEPLQENHAALQELCKMDNNWEIAPRMALGDKNAEVSINVSQSNDMSSILPLTDATIFALEKSRYTGTQTVPLKTLDEIFDRYTAKGEKVFVKVDTQGFEMAVLQGATESMRQKKIAGWQLELSLLPLYQGEKLFDEISVWLSQRGYEPHLVIPGYFSKRLMRQMQIDIIYFLKNGTA